MEILKTINITKEFDGLIAVNNLSFSLQKGKITGLIGPNGSGKTTLLNVITGLYRIQRGQVYFRRKQITNFPSYRIAQIGIARTFQNIRVFPQISVLDNVLLATKYVKGERLLSALLRTKSMIKEERENREIALNRLGSLGLDKKKDELAENLSHGQRKLLELCRAWSTGSDLLLLDEPTSGIFSEVKNIILDTLLKLKEEGKTILFIEHDLKTVFKISDKVVVMSNGEKVSEGKPAEVKKEKKVIDVYLGEKNFAS